MRKLIERKVALRIVKDAENGFLYKKDPQNPETFNAYNEGWTDACELIMAQLWQAKVIETDTAMVGKAVSHELLQQLNPKKLDNFKETIVNGLCGKLALMLFQRGMVTKSFQENPVMDARTYMVSIEFVPTEDVEREVEYKWMEDDGEAEYGSSD